MDEATRRHIPRRNYRAGADGEENGVGSDQLVLDGRTSRGGARGDLELAVYRTQVCIGSTRTHDELLGDLGGGQPPRHQTQNFDLASGQAEGITPRRKD